MSLVISKKLCCYCGSDKVAVDPRDINGDYCTECGAIN
jgi:hypothetical protein